jgi:hypothetical protein
MAQDQEGESVGEPMDQAPVEMPQPEMQVPQEVLEFLQDRRPASALSDEELGQRAKQARQLLKMNGLSPQSRRDIKAVSEELRAERQTRMAAAQNSGPDVQQGKAADAESEPVPAPSEMPAETNGEAVEAAPAEPVESAPQVPPEVAAFLADARPPAELSVEELGQRSKQARDLLAIKGLDPATQQELRAIAKRLRSERAALVSAGVEHTFGGGVEVRTTGATPEKAMRAAAFVSRGALPHVVEGGGHVEPLADSHLASDAHGVQEALWKRGERHQRDSGFRTAFT